MEAKRMGKFVGFCFLPIVNEAVIICWMVSNFIKMLLFLIFIKAKKENFFQNIRNKIEKLFKNIWIEDLCLGVMYRFIKMR